MKGLNHVSVRNHLSNYQLEIEKQRNRFVSSWKWKNRVARASFVDDYFQMEMEMNESTLVLLTNLLSVQSISNNFKISTVTMSRAYQR
jgi:hypothetical protein